MLQILRFITGEHFRISTYTVHIKLEKNNFQDFAQGSIIATKTTQYLN